MPGGLLQLLSVGLEDAPLTLNPEVTFFKTTYRQHTNFSIEQIVKNIGKKKFNSSHQFKIEKVSDLIAGLHLIIDIPYFDVTTTQTTTATTNTNLTVINEFSVLYGNQKTYLYYETTTNKYYLIPEQFFNLSKNDINYNNVNGFDLENNLLAGYNIITTQNYGLNVPIVSLKNSSLNQILPVLRLNSNQWIEFWLRLLDERNKFNYFTEIITQKSLVNNLSIKLNKIVYDYYNNYNVFYKNNQYLNFPNEIKQYFSLANTYIKNPIYDSDYAFNYAIINNYVIQTYKDNALKFNSLFYLFLLQTIYPDFTSNVKSFTFWKKYSLNTNNIVNTSKTISQLNYSLEWSKRFSIYNTTSYGDLNSLELEIYNEFLVNYNNCEISIKTLYNTLSLGEKEKTWCILKVFYERFTDTINPKICFDDYFMDIDGSILLENTILSYYQNIYPTLSINSTMKADWSNFDDSGHIQPVDLNLMYLYLLYNYVDSIIKTTFFSDTFFLVLLRNKINIAYYFRLADNLDNYKIDKTLTNSLQNVFYEMNDYGQPIKNLTFYQNINITRDININTISNEIAKSINCQSFYGSIDVNDTSNLTVNTIGNSSYNSLQDTSYNIINQNIEITDELNINTYLYDPINKIIEIRNWYNLSFSQVYIKNNNIFIKVEKFLFDNNKLILYFDVVPSSLVNLPDGSDFIKYPQIDATNWYNSNPQIYLKLVQNLEIPIVNITDFNSSDILTDTNISYTSNILFDTSNQITTVNDMSGNTILIDISYNPLLCYQIEILYLNNTNEKINVDISNNIIIQNLNLNFSDIKQVQLNGYDLGLEFICNVGSRLDSNYNSILDLSGNPYVGNTKNFYWLIANNIKTNFKNIFPVKYANGNFYYYFPGAAYFPISNYASYTWELYNINTLAPNLFNILHHISNPNNQENSIILQMNQSFYQSPMIFPINTVNNKPLYHFYNFPVTDNTVSITINNNKINKIFEVYSSEYYRDLSQNKIPVVFEYTSLVNEFYDASPANNNPTIINNKQFITKYLVDNLTSLINTDTFSNIITTLENANKLYTNLLNDGITLLTQKGVTINTVIKNSNIINNTNLSLYKNLDFQNYSLISPKYYNLTYDQISNGIGLNKFKLDSSWIILKQLKDIYKPQNKILSEVIEYLKNVPIVLQNNITYVNNNQSLLDVYNENQYQENYDFKYKLENTINSNIVNNIEYTIKYLYDLSRNNWTSNNTSIYFNNDIIEVGPKIGDSSNTAVGQTSSNNLFEIKKEISYHTDIYSFDIDNYNNDIFNYIGPINFTKNNFNFYSTINNNNYTSILLDDMTQININEQTKLLDTSENSLKIYYNSYGTKYDTTSELLPPFRIINQIMVVANDNKDYIINNYKSNYYYRFNDSIIRGSQITNLDLIGNFNLWIYPNEYLKLIDTGTTASISNKIITFSSTTNLPNYSYYSVNGFIYYIEIISSSYTLTDLIIPNTSSRKLYLLAETNFKKRHNQYASEKYYSPIIMSNNNLNKLEYNFNSSDILYANLKNIGIINKTNINGNQITLNEIDNYKYIIAINSTNKYFYNVINIDSSNNILTVDDNILPGNYNIYGCLKNIIFTKNMLNIVNNNSNYTMSATKNSLNIGDIIMVQYNIFEVLGLKNNTNTNSYDIKILKKNNDIIALNSGYYLLFSQNILPHIPDYDPIVNLTINDTSNYKFVIDSSDNLVMSNANISNFSIKNNDMINLYYKNGVFYNPFNYLLNNGDYLVVGVNLIQIKYIQNGIIYTKQPITSFYTSEGFYSLYYPYQPCKMINLIFDSSGNNNYSNEFIFFEVDISSNPVFVKSRTTLTNIALYTRVMKIPTFKIYFENIKNTHINGSIIGNKLTITEDLSGYNFYYNQSILINSVIKNIKNKIGNVFTVSDNFSDLSSNISVQIYFNKVMNQYIYCNYKLDICSYLKPFLSPNNYNYYFVSNNEITDYTVLNFNTITLNSLDWLETYQIYHDSNVKFRDNVWNRDVSNNLITQNTSYHILLEKTINNQFVSHLCQVIFPNKIFLYTPVEDYNSTFYLDKIYPIYLNYDNTFSYYAIQMYKQTEILSLPSNQVIIWTKYPSINIIGVIESINPGYRVQIEAVPGAGFDISGILNDKNLYIDKSIKCSIQNISGQYYLYSTNYPGQFDYIYSKYTNYIISLTPNKSEVIIPNNNIFTRPFQIESIKLPISLEIISESTLIYYQFKKSYYYMLTDYNKTDTTVSNYSLSNLNQNIVSTYIDPTTKKRVITTQINVTNPDIFYINNNNTNIFDESTILLDIEDEIQNIFNDTNFINSILLNKLKSWDSWSILTNPEKEKNTYLYTGQIEFDFSSIIFNNVNGYKPRQYEIYNTPEEGVMLTEEDVILKEKDFYYYIPDTYLWWYLFFDKVTQNYYISNFYVDNIIVSPDNGYYTFDDILAVFTFNKDPENADNKKTIAGILNNIIEQSQLVLFDDQSGFISYADIRYPFQNKNLPEPSLADPISFTTNEVNDISSYLFDPKFNFETYKKTVYYQNKIYNALNTLFKYEVFWDDPLIYINNFAQDISSNIRFDGTNLYLNTIKLDTILNNQFVITDISGSSNKYIVKRVLDSAKKEITNIINNKTSNSVYGVKIDAVLKQLVYLSQEYKNIKTSLRKSTNTTQNFADLLLNLLKSNLYDPSNSLNINLSNLQTELAVDNIDLLGVNVITNQITYDSSYNEINIISSYPYETNQYLYLTNIPYNNNYNIDTPNGLYPYKILLTDDTYEAYTIYKIDFLSGQNTLTPNITIENPIVYNNQINFYSTQDFDITNQFSICSYKTYDLSASLIGYVYTTNITSINLNSFTTLKYKNTELQMFNDYLISPIKLDTLSSYIQAEIPISVYNISNDISNNITNITVVNLNVTLDVLSTDYTIYYYDNNIHIKIIDISNTVLTVNNTITTFNFPKIVVVFKKSNIEDTNSQLYQLVLTEPITDYLNYINLQNVMNNFMINDEIQVKDMKFIDGNILNVLVNTLQTDYTIKTLVHYAKIGEYPPELITSLNKLDTFLYTFNQTVSINDQTSCFVLFDLEYDINKDADVYINKFLRNITIYPVHSSTNVITTPTLTKFLTDYYIHDEDVHNHSFGGVINIFDISNYTYSNNILSFTIPNNLVLDNNYSYLINNIYVDALIITNNIIKISWETPISNSVILKQIIIDKYIQKPQYNQLITITLNNDFDLNENGYLQATDKNGKELGQYIYQISDLSNNPIKILAISSNTNVIINNNSMNIGQILSVDPLCIITNTLIENISSVTIMETSVTYINITATTIQNTYMAFQLYKQIPSLSGIKIKKYQLLIEENNLFNITNFTFTENSINRYSLISKYSIFNLQKSYDSQILLPTPELTVTTSTTTTTITKSEPAYFVDELYKNFFEKIEFMIGDQVIEELNSDIMDIQYQFYKDPQKRKQLNKLTQVYDHDGQMRLVIPLEFWFNNISTLFIPLLSLPYTDVTLRFKINPLSQLVTNTNYKLNSIPEINIQVNIDGILLDTAEQELFGKNQHEYIIERFKQYPNSLINSTNSINKMFFKNLIKNIFFITNIIGTNDKVYYNTTIELDKYQIEYNNVKTLYLEFIKTNRYTNEIPNTYASDFKIMKRVIKEASLKVSFRYITFMKSLIISKYNPELTLYIDTKYQNNISSIDGKKYNLELYYTKVYKFVTIKSPVSPINIMNIQSNGSDLFTPIDIKYFSKIVPYQKFFTSIDDGFYGYTFAMYPLENQPSGHLNFSLLDNIVINTTNNSQVVTNPVILKTIVKEYQILRIMSGMCGLSWEN